MCNKHCTATELPSIRCPSQNLWVGLSWVCWILGWVGLGREIWTHVQLCTSLQAKCNTNKQRRGVGYWRSVSRQPLQISYRPITFVLFLDTVIPRVRVSVRVKKVKRSCFGGMYKCSANDSKELRRRSNVIGRYDICSGCLERLVIWAPDADCNFPPPKVVRCLMPPYHPNFCRLSRLPPGAGRPFRSLWLHHCE